MLFSCTVLDIFVQYPVWVSQGECKILAKIVQNRHFPVIKSILIGQNITNDYSRISIRHDRFFNGFEQDQGLAKMEFSHSARR